MIRLLQILTLAGLSCFITGAVSAQIQNMPKNQLGEFDEIVIKHKSDKDGKVTVEVKNGDILVNGKKLDQFNDPDLSVFRRSNTPRNGNTFSYDSNDPRSGFEMFNGGDEENDNEDMPVAPNKAMLGVITEKTAATGVTVKTVAKGTPADKAGIKTGDIITTIDNEEINEPAALFEVIGKHKPADKITVTYTRNGKTSKANVTLDERKDINPGGNWSMYPPFSAMPKKLPRRFSFPPSPHDRQDFGNNWFNREEQDVKLGLQVQDTEHNEGAQVIDIAIGSPAEIAGFKKDDIVTDLAGNHVTSVSDLSKAYRENRDKGSITATVKRNGQTQTLEIKVPKKLHKADL